MSVQPRDLQALIRETAKCSKSGKGKLTLHDAEKYFLTLVRLDYARALRTHFDRRQFRELLSELHRALPGLNRRLFYETDLGWLAGVAARFGAVLETRCFDDPEGRALRGFYANDRAVLKHPLICVNTAGHPIGVTAAFWHEIGHHLTHEIFGGGAGRFNLTVAPDYHNHLKSPEELVADTVMVFAAYPNGAAQRLFGAARGARTSCRPDLLVHKALRHLRSVSGFEFPTQIGDDEKLHILAGMIHAAKLRLTLLQEYRV